MPVRLEGVCLAPLRDVSLAFEDGTVVGLVGPDGAGKSALLRSAAGCAGRSVLIEAGPRAREELAEAWASDPEVVLIDHALALVDGAAQVRAIQQIHKLRRRGVVVLISSHDLPLLERVCDVVVALEEGRVVEQGDPGLVLAGYRKRMPARSDRTAGGAGRVEVASVEILEENGTPTTTVRSGEPVTVAAKLRFRETVENPVAGMLIRSRIGMSVYGTNTELEQVPIGTRRAGETARVEFEFRCDLCPQDYSLTVASHDPDGTAHNWLEEAMLFTVVDTRYTAGVANLRARVRAI
jgi:lipopolysaccharide transport system ATP-binding protein